MKKFLSFLLVISSVFSSGMTSFAEITEDISMDIKTEVIEESEDMLQTTIDSEQICDVSEENVVNDMTEDELLTYQKVQDENEFLEMGEEEIEILSVEEDDVISGWYSCGTMRSDRSHMASAVVEDTIYTFGGQEDGNAVAKVEKFVTPDEIWYGCASMPSERYNHSAVAINNKIYICAGYDKDGAAVSEIDVYDILTNSWESAIETPNYNTNYAAVAYNNELYIISGYEGENENKIAVDKIYKYNFDLAEWSLVNNINHELIDGKAVLSDKYIAVFANYKMYFYNVAENSIPEYNVYAMEREVVDFAVMDRDFTESTSFATDAQRLGFYVTGGHPEDSDISTAATTAYYSGGNFTSDASWHYDLRLIRGLSGHNMVLANNYIYIFGGQVVKGTDQDLMFKRRALDPVDDVPVITELKNGAVVGSINGYGDTDSFTIIPERTSIYSFRPYTYWDGLEFTLKDSSGKQLGTFYYQGETDKYLYGFERLLEKGETYTITLQVPLSYDDQCGEYSFRYIPIDDDAPNYIDEAYDINIDRTHSKKFEGINDIDYFKFEISDWGKYELNVNVSSGNEMDYAIYENNNDIYTVIYDFDVTSVESFNDMNLKKGTYYIGFQGTGGEYSFYINRTGNVHHLFTNRCKHEMVVIDGKIYAIGGVNNEFDSVNSIELYNPIDKLWYKDTTGLAFKREFGAASIDDRLYLIGGYDSNGYSNKVELYDIENKTLSTVGQISTAKERAGLTVVDDKIYVAGGRNNVGYLNGVEIYDTTNNTVTTTSSLPRGIVDPQVYFYNDVLYVIAGIDEDGFSDKVYALEDDIWVEKASMPYVSEYVRGKVYNGDFYCAAVNSQGNVDVLKYDTENNIWSTLIENAVNSRIYYSVEILNGFFYITGGYSAADDIVKGDMYSFDIVTDISTMDTAIPVRTIGYEYEQSINDIVNGPQILGVNAKVVDSNKGIYELYLAETRIDSEGNVVHDYTYDSRSVPFFFWSSREGMFTALSDDYTRVMFYADKGTGDRQVKVVVGIGDGRGYVDKKSFLLVGNSEVE